MQIIAHYKRRVLHPTLSRIRPSLAIVGIGWLVATSFFKSGSSSHFLLLLFRSNIAVAAVRSSLQRPTNCPRITSPVDSLAQSKGSKAAHLFDQIHRAPMPHALCCTINLLNARIGCTRLGKNHGRVEVRARWECSGRENVSHHLVRHQDVPERVC